MCYSFDLTQCKAQILKWLELLRTSKQKANCIDLVDVVSAVENYLRNFDETSWEGFESPKICLERLRSLGVQRKRENGKWYSNNNDTTGRRSSICLGCAIFRGVICKALPQCPLSLCYGSECVKSSHPTFQSIKCHLSHHSTATNSIDNGTQEGLCMKDPYDDGGHHTVAYIADTIIGKITACCILVIIANFHGCNRRVVCQAFETKQGLREVHFKWYNVVT